MRLVGSAAAATTTTTTITTTTKKEKHSEWKWLHCPSIHCRTKWSFSLETDDLQPPPPQPQPPKQFIYESHPAPLALSHWKKESQSLLLQNTRRKYEMGETQFAKLFLGLLGDNNKCSQEFSWGQQQKQQQIQQRVSTFFEQILVWCM